MLKHYTKLLLLLLVGCIALTASAQEGYWLSRADKNGITTDKAVARASYPKEFKLFTLDITPLRQKLFSITGRNASARSAVVTLPSANGSMEQFEVFEASNFEPALQARFPEIRAFSGKSITNPGSTLKISIAPGGVQTMVFRANGNANEYIEPYSADHTIYSVFKSQRNKGTAPWVCSTPDQKLATSLTNGIQSPLSSTGQLKTLRLAQSVTAEYSNYFGATSAAQVALVLAAVNATLTRCNGVYEKDLAVHLNLIANTTNVFYYDPNTDPYSPAATGAAGAWNGQLQSTLTSVIGEANYDIGHLFGASGGGGNAGCIGCVCTNGSKGSGFTSPANAVPLGDDFDIDYVVHEVGHQLGANHTFSFGLEGTGQNKEVGSGITIMGYAGITGNDVAPHSIDIFHETSIEQIQVNLATKTCPVTTPLTGINATPVVGALTNYTIPPSTPFVLTGSATDANPGDVLTYCWEQNDNSTTSGANSVASPTKTTGPNWLSFSPTTSPARTCPVLPTILAGNSVTGPLPGGDAGANIEALSSVSRALNFRLTVRDNRPYNSGTGAVGQTNFGDMAVTVDATNYTPFLITSQNSAVSYIVGSTQTVTWSVGNTTAAPISCANVKISLSTDGGNTFTTLIASTPNDGTQTFTVPTTPTTTARIKVEAIGNIFFDINNSNITFALPPNGFVFNAPPAVLSGCPVPTSMQTTLTASFLGTFTGPVTLTASGNPAGTTVVFGTNPLSSASASTTVTLTGTNTLANGSYTISVTGTGTAIPTQTQDIIYTVDPSIAPVINTQPANLATCAGATASFSVVASGASAYQWQISTDAGVTWANITGATSATYSFATVTADNGKRFRCNVANGCAAVTTTNPAILSIIVLSGGNLTPANVSACTTTNTTTLTLSGTVGNIIQWERSTDGGTTWTIIANTTPTLTVTNLTQTSLYRVLVQNPGCTAVYSTTSTVTFVPVGLGALSIAANQGIVLCQGDPTLLTVVTPTAAGPCSTASGSINIPISTGAGADVVVPAMSVSCAPAGAVLSSVAVTLNITHTWDSDLTVFLKSPSGRVINLINGRGSNGDNFTNTVISSASSTSLSTGVAPFTGTFAADGISTNPPAGFTQTDATFASFITNSPAVNGSWSLGVRDNAAGDGGSVNNWSLSLGYNTLAPVPAGLTFVWSPAAGLSNTTTNPVAASPAVSTVYTVNVANATGCTGTASISITVNTRPSITAQPAPLVSCENSTVSFTAAGAGTGAALRWQESTNGGTTYTDINNGGIYSGATTGTLTLTGVTASMNNNLYRLSVSGTCPPVAYSTGAKLTVNPAPAVVVTPATGCGGLAGTNGLLLTASGANSYSWSPVAGLYTNATATTAYTGTSTATVYAAPTAFTTYTVTGTNAATGCTKTATANINYTPTAPIINPSPANICFADSIIMLTKAQPNTLSFTSGAINVPIIDNALAGGKNTISVSGVPAGASITGVVVKMNATHSWAGDLVVVLKAPNNQILNLDYCLSQTNNGSGVLAPAFANTLVSSAGGATFGSGTQPYTGTFKADASTSASFFGAPTGPTGFNATTGQWKDLYSTPNGSWTLAWADVFGGGDVGTFTDWSLDILYQVGTPSTAPVWSPAAGLYTNATATIPYVLGTPRDTVWAKVPKTPLPGSYNYQVTANSLPSAGAPIGSAATNFPDNNGFGLVTFNVKNSNTYDVMITDIASVVFFTDAHDVAAFYKPSAINGAPGAINEANGWKQFGSGSIIGTGLVQPFMSGLGLVIPAGATYGIAVQASEVGFGADIDYSTLAAGTYTFTAGGCSIVTGTNIGYGGDLAPVAPANTPRGFIGSVTFANVAVPCTSPSRTITVTINDSVKIVSQPVNTSACQDKTATFTVGATGTGLTYQWQVILPGGTSYNNISNGGVYSGVTSATLSVSNPPASMDGYFYRCLVSGITPCGGKITNAVKLTVNAFPIVTIDASPYRKLFPGLRTTVFSTVGTPGGTYAWLRNGVAVSGSTSSLVVGVDGIGDYSVKYTDLNGCTSTSNTVSISDSASGKVFIYPNPNGGQFQVRYYSVNNNTGLPRGVNVYDSRGKRVVTQTYSITAPYSRMDVDLSNYSTGVYWIEVVDVNGNRLAMGRAEVLR